MVFFAEKNRLDYDRINSTVFYLKITELTTSITLLTVLSPMGDGHHTLANLAA